MLDGETSSSSSATAADRVQNVGASLAHLSVWLAVWSFVPIQQPGQKLHRQTLRTKRHIHNTVVFTGLRM